MGRLDAPAPRAAKERRPRGCDQRLQIDPQRIISGTGSNAKSYAGTEWLVSEGERLKELYLHNEAREAKAGA